MYICLFVCGPDGFTCSFPQKNNGKDAYGGDWQVLIVILRIYSHKFNRHDETEKQIYIQDSIFTKRQVCVYVASFCTSVVPGGVAFFFKKTNWAKYALVNRPFGGSSRATLPGALKKSSRVKKRV